MLNAKTLHQTPYEAVSARISMLDAPAGKPFWDAVKPNITSLRDLVELGRLVTGPVTPVIEDAGLAAKAAAALRARGV